MMTKDENPRDHVRNQRTIPSRFLAACVFGLLAVGAMNYFSSLDAVSRADAADKPTPKVRLTSGSSHAAKTTKESDKKLVDESPDFSPGKQSASKPKPAPKDDSKLKERRPLSTFPQFGTAKTRAHRVIEIRLNEITGEPARKREDKAVSVLARDGSTRDLLLKTSSVFYLVDELVSSRNDGTALSPDELLEAFSSEQVVLLTHQPNELPTSYAATLRGDVIVIQLPLMPKLPVDAAAYGVTKEDDDGVYLNFNRPWPAIASFPQLCCAKTKELGVIELQGCTLYYFSPDQRGKEGIFVNTLSGKRELTLSGMRFRYLATELTAYNRSGKELNRAQLLSHLSPTAVVLVTIAPQQIPAEYLALLDESTVILEVPYEPVVKISTDEHLADAVYPLPPSGLPDVISTR